MRIIDLILEGFAKRGVYSKSEISFVEMGYYIEASFNILTYDIKDASIRDKICFILIKYMIWRLSKPLRRERREELVREYGKDFKYNIRNNVFSAIMSVPHEIVHEILHEGSVDYFVKQNLNLSRDLEVEFIYDFFEVLAGMFDSWDYWNKDDAKLWTTFKMKLKYYFFRWLQKNNFFSDVEDFEKAYNRFLRAFDKIDEFASNNVFFEKFWKVYMKPYAYEVIRSEAFKEELKMRVNDKDKEKKNDGFFGHYIYDFIISEIFQDIDEAFKDRFVLTVDILSKIGQTLYELHNIYLRREDIIKLIRERVLEGSFGGTIK